MQQMQQLQQMQLMQLLQSAESELDSDSELDSGSPGRARAAARPVGRVDLESARPGARQGPRA